MSVFSIPCASEDQRGKVDRGGKTGTKRRQSRVLPSSAHQTNFEENVECPLAEKHRSGGGGSGDLPNRPPDLSPELLARAGALCPTGGLDAANRDLLLGPG